MVRLPVDLRSDTVTRPTAAMRAAMAAAEVGDDVFGDDRTVAQLESMTATLLGKEAAMYVPSGTMSNQIGVRVHCRPGDEIILDAGCHIYNHEQGGVAQLSGLATRTVDGLGGVMRLEQLTDLIRPRNIHYAQTRLVCIENTHNRGGGRVQPLDELERISSWARSRSLAMHLDGARLFNAVVASGIPAVQWAAPFDTVSVCFSKGLGAPVGSALAGPKALIDQARWHRKLFGGAMRQAGIVAAGAVYALEHHVDRLAEDHVHAQQLAATIREIEGLQLKYDSVETNIVFFTVDERLGGVATYSRRLHERGVLVMAESASTIRLVTHLDVGSEEIAFACEQLRQAARELPDVDRRDTLRSAYA